MENLDLSFDIYHLDDKVGRVEIVNNKIVKNEVYTNNPLLTLFPAHITLPNLLAALEDRVICSSRYTPELAQLLGIPTYNRYNILKITHGVNIDDCIWLKFDNDPGELTWYKLKER